MHISLTPFLLAIELGFAFMLAWRTRGLAPATVRLRPLWIHLSWISVFGIATSILGAHGVYTSEALLRLWPGFWLQLITVAACVLPVVVSRNLRNDLRLIVDNTPWHWFAYFQGLRVAALGTAYKTWIGEFPLSFELLVGVPDLLFGLSAFWIAGKAKHGEIGRRTFMLWNLAGALVIVPSAPLVLQLGLPSPIQVFTALPDARAVFTYPMSIAPMISVPLLVLMNLLVAWRLWESSHAAGSSYSNAVFSEDQALLREPRAVEQEVH